MTCRLKVDHHNYFPKIFGGQMGADGADTDFIRLFRLAGHYNQSTVGTNLPTTSSYDLSYLEQPVHVGSMGSVGRVGG